MFSGLGWGADTPTAKPPGAQRLLLLYQAPDGHPPQTHEYQAGLRRLQRTLSGQQGLEVRLVPADEPWTDGPELLDGADAVVVFLAEGAAWLSRSPERLAAFQNLAKRGTGFTCLHWGMGTKQAEPIAAFASLFGGCHGGPDRKYKVLNTQLVPVASHPITRGILTTEVHDEFYYALKWPSGSSPPTPVARGTIDDREETIAWAWERPDGGRSFGFSGLHFHRNWEQSSYERLVTQGVLWTLQREIPSEGIRLVAPTNDDPARN